MTDWKEKYKEKKYTEIIDMFLKNGASPNIRTDDKDSKTLLYLAVNTENVNLVRTILDAGADPNLHNEGYTPLTAACEEIDLEIMELLLEHGAAPNSENNDEPHLGWILGSDESISKKLNGTKLLLKYGYDPNKIYY
jgi:ankyrin repeat protein